ncbi:MAG: hypothetical protein N3A53_01795, partial [Verrucomicrobiae bacterium]|nr:hypothetical protein [Verrucomicrobiae bacterium]
AYATAMWHRLRARRNEMDRTVSRTLPEFAMEPWLAVQHRHEDIAWAVPCFTGRDKIIGRNVRCVLVGTTAGRLVLIGKRLFRTRYRVISPVGAHWVEDPGALFHVLCIKPTDGAPLRVRFTRRHSPALPAILEWLEQHRQPAAAPASVSA